MKMSRKFKNKQKLGRTVCMIFALLLVFGIYLAWAGSQRHNFSPDEGMRSRIVQYIYEHGKLPHGGDPEIRDEDWGISYAFNPILKIQYADAVPNRTLTILAEINSAHSSVVKNEVIFINNAEIM